MTSSLYMSYMTSSRGARGRGGAAWGRWGLRTHVQRNDPRSAHCSPQQTNDWAPLTRDRRKMHRPQGPGRGDAPALVMRARTGDRLGPRPEHNAGRPPAARATTAADRVLGPAHTQTKQHAPAPRPSGRRCPDALCRGKEGGLPRAPVRNRRTTKWHSGRGGRGGKG